MAKKLIVIFIAAFVLNAVWEHIHSLLYVHYMEGDITSFILFKAALFDALIITLFAYIFKNIKYIVPVAVLFSIGLEFWAINAGRWAYNDHMPLMFGIGITPAIQLGLLAYISVKISQCKKL